MHRAAVSTLVAVAIATVAVLAFGHGLFAAEPQRVTFRFQPPKGETVTFQGAQERTTTTTLGGRSHKVNEKFTGTVTHEVLGADNKNLTLVRRVFSDVVMDVTITSDGQTKSVHYESKNPPREPSMEERWIEIGWKYPVTLKLNSRSAAMDIEADDWIDATWKLVTPVEQQGDKAKFAHHKERTLETQRESHNNILSVLPDVPLVVGES